MVDFKYSRGLWLFLRDCETESEDSSRQRLPWRW